MAASTLGRPGRARFDLCAQRRRSHWRCHNRLSTAGVIDVNYFYRHI
jgi:hypothetical protein